MPHQQEDARTRLMKKHALVITLLAALTACSPEGTDGEQPTSAPPAANEAATAASGTLELAISQTCAPGSDPQCIPLNDEHILVAPAAFERIGVDSASSAPSSGEFDMINVTLDNDGATVARKMTNEASIKAHLSRQCERVYLRYWQSQQTTQHRGENQKKGKMKKKCGRAG